MNIKYAQHRNENPEIWAMFEKLTLRLINSGVRHFGAKCIMENVRYNTALKTKGEQYKINNNYTAYYAREFASKYPQYADFFEIRNNNKHRGNNEQNNERNMVAR